MSTSLTQRIYAGELVRMTPSVASRALCAKVLTMLTEACSGHSPRTLHTVLGQDAMMVLLREAQHTVRSSREVSSLAARLVASSGIPLDGVVIDAVRLRAVTPDGHTRPEARGAYAVHRDTWYANSQSQLNWWLPLFDVTALDSFRIYAPYFAQAIGNTSGDFDYASWVERVGWQTRGKAALGDYPAALATPDTAGAVDVTALASSVLVFSGQHLHGTLPNQTDTIRYSIDFRTVRRTDDADGVGAPRVDNDSRGEAVADYRDAVALVEAS